MMANNNYASWYKFFPWKMGKVYLVLKSLLLGGGSPGTIRIHYIPVPPETAPIDWFILNLFPGILCFSVAIVHRIVSLTWFSSC